MKRNGILNIEDSLSIQDFINHFPADVQRLGIENLGVAVEMLEQVGAILHGDGPPLTFVLSSCTC